MAHSHRTALAGPSKVPITSFHHARSAPRNHLAFRADLRLQSREGLVHLFNSKIRAANESTRPVENGGCCEWRKLTLDCREPGAVILRPVSSGRRFKIRWQMNPRAWWKMAA